MVCHIGSPDREVRLQSTLHDRVLNRLKLYILKNGHFAEKRMININSCMVVKTQKNFRLISMIC